MARVFIPNASEERHPQAWTETPQWGTPVFITTGAVDTHRPDRLMDDMRLALGDFNPDEDLIMVVGAVLTTALALACVAVNGCGRVRLLVWDGRQQTYKERPLRLVA